MILRKGRVKIKKVKNIDMRHVIEESPEKNTTNLTDYVSTVEAPQLNVAFLHHQAFLSSLKRIGF